MQLPQPSEPRIPLQPHQLLTTSHGNHCVFDFDTWTYDVAFAAEKDGILRPFSYCMELVDERFRCIMERCGASTFNGYLTGTNNFRKSIATVKPYKGNRVAEKPHWYSSLRDYLVNRYGAVIVDGMEADDAIAIYATSATDKSKIVIVSRDKDLLQVPFVMHYRYPLFNSSECLVQPANIYPFLKFLGQVVTGDSTDNYPGLPRKGEVFYEKLKEESSTAKDLFNRVLFAYVEHYGETGIERFLEQARLAWLVRELDQDGNPILPTAEFKFYEQYYSF